MSLLVTFEGPEGSGKSTQTRLVGDLLQAAGIPTLITREPGGTPLGERVRTVLLDPGDYAIVPRAEALLMTAARAQHVEDVILPALEDGVLVLCDRFIDSTLAYQGAGRGLPVKDLELLQRLAFAPITPDLTILLDLPPETGLERRHGSGVPLNRLDQDDLAFHQRVRDWYLRAASADNDRWRVIDAEQQPDTIANLILETITTRINHEHRDAPADRTS